MSNWGHLFLRLYRVLLAFYPAGFRSKFGEEMQADFQIALAETQRIGGIGVEQLLWREIRYWPGSVWREHLRARRMKMPSTGFIEENPLTRSELLAAMVIFLLPILSISLTIWLYLPQWIQVVLTFLFWGFTIYSVGLAIARRMPRWSLSYLGFLLIIGTIVGRIDRVWTWIYPYFIQSFGARSMWPLGIRIIYGAGGALTFIFSILFGALILVSFLRLIPYTRIIWLRIRTDWTQLSFLIYGSIVFLVIFAFEEYRYDDIWKLAAWASLAVGAWVYLRAKGQKQRILALICGATGAMWIIAVGTWFLIPLQDWQARYSLIAMQDLRRTDTSVAIIGWICILLAMIAPALLNLLPTSHSLDTRKDITPA
jgi:hypothetical protein